MTRSGGLLVLFVVALSLATLSGCGKKTAVGGKARQPSLTIYHENPPAKLEPVEIPPIVKERKGDPKQAPPSSRN